MANFPRLILHKRKADAIKRFHPWVFSGAIQQTDGELREGAIVEVCSSSGDFLGLGHYGTGSIAAKLFAFTPVADVEQLLHQKLAAAYRLRQQLGLTNSPTTNCYRLVNAEGDGLPGLVIDWYNGVAVIQAHSIGMYESRQTLTQALQQIYGSDLTAVYDKSAALISGAADQYLYGAASPAEVLESGHRFFVDWETGQKTGFFVDQREHRQLLTQFVSDRKVLNTFCYSGGFSIYALQAGAKQVHSVDSSIKAIGWMKDNLALNPAAGEHEAFDEDVFRFLKDCDADYDVVVLDPPAFAKNLSARHQAVMAYKRLNQLAMSKLKPGGILFTFSCSQVVLPEYFQGAVTAAAIETGRPTKILHRLSQPADHPVSIYHPEGLYLKGLVLQIE